MSDEMYNFKVAYDKVPDKLKFIPLDDSSDQLHKIKIALNHLKAFPDLWEGISIDEKLSMPQITKTVAVIMFKENIPDMICCLASKKNDTLKMIKNTVNSIGNDAITVGECLTQDQEFGWDFDLYTGFIMSSQGFHYYDGKNVHFWKYGDIKEIRVADSDITIYHPTSGIEISLKPFLSAEKIDSADPWIHNYLSQAYSNFDIILKAYPNAEIKTNTNRDRLTEKQVINFLRRIKYENVGEKKYPELTEAISERCIKLAEVVGYYGYSQEQFEKLQNWFIQGIKQGSNIVCGSDSEENEITFELLAKDNPLGAVLGNITNCCQRAGDAAEGCVRHGMSDPNGGFVVFRKGKRIIGQAWVWYNEEMEKICYDNIEVPNSAKRLVRENSEEFVSCLKRASLSMVESMSKKGKKVSTVTMGKGYNDLLNLIKNKAEEFEKESERLGGAPANYSDTRPGEVRVLGALVTAAILGAVCQHKQQLPVHSLGE